MILKVIHLFAVSFARDPTPQGCPFSTSPASRQKPSVESIMQQGPTIPLLTPTGWLPSSALINILQVLSEEYVSLPLCLTHSLSKHLKQASYCQPNQKRLALLSPRDIPPGPGFVKHGGSSCAVPIQGSEGGASRACLVFFH